ncbi:class I SAM-dependent methyltransferase [Lentisalinibacter salinarum]|uniref:class I SAM-dependent methyltransferase n=1 Tax=Lentisalinibacter salinarum TaxID=2992239 RepID=UPI00386E34C8
MSEQDADITSSWDAYWQGARDAAAYTGGGSSHPAVTGFWEAFFREAAALYECPLVVDVASGNGAVTGAARAQFGDAGRYVCVDVSAAAVRAIGERYPDVRGVVADARAMPIASGSATIAVSQFGIEYAGPGAFPELLRLVGDGGRTALLVHRQGGGIHRQCAASRDAMQAIIDARFLPLAHDLFEAGFAAMRGGDRERYRQAGRSFAPALRAVEQLMRRHGQHVADGTVIRLYRDIRTMHERMARYEPADVLGWLERMDAEVQAYAGRMASMCEAAVDEEAFRGLCARAREAGFTLLREDELGVAETGVPLAWVLVAVRGEA